MRKFPSDPFTHGAANRDAEQEALEWVVRLSSGEVTEADISAFTIWNDDADNAAAYVAATKLWRGLGRVLTDHDVDAEPVTRDVVKPGPTAIRWQRGRRWAAAAALLLTTGTVYQYFHVWRFDHVSPAHSHDFTTTLADGTQVTLGPDAAFNVRFDKGRRVVQLARGEAFFDVIHDASRPFVVEVGQGAVRDLGTAFSVRRGNNGTVDVVVARGRVGVSDTGHDVVLTPDRAVRFDSDVFGPIRAVDASLATAWMRGRLILENEPLADVLNELNRFSARSIILMNREAGQRRMNVVVDLNRIDGWLTALGASQKLKVTRLGPVVLIR